MIQPIRPNDAAGVYQRQAVSTDGVPDAARDPGRRTGRTARAGRHNDQVTISAEAQSLQRALSAVEAGIDVRADRVALIRQQLAQGTYRLDPYAIAERLAGEGSGS